MAELVRYARRHEGLLGALRRRAARWSAPALPVAAVALPHRLPVSPSGPASELAQQIADVVIELGPLLLDDTLADAADWLGQALVAVSGAAPERAGPVYLLAGAWRVLHAAATPANGDRTAGYEAAATEAYARVADPLAHVAAGCLIGTAQLTYGRREEAAAGVARLQAELAACSGGGARQALVANALAHCVRVASLGVAPLEEASDLCRRALGELGRSGEGQPYLAALLATNAETLARVAGEENRRALVQAVSELRELQREPWLRAALLAHAATLGVPIGFVKPEDALTAARDELRAAIAACPPEETSGLLWFLTLAAYHVLAQQDAGHARFGLATLAWPAADGLPVMPELPGMELVLQLSRAALRALLDRDTVALALRLAEQSTQAAIAAPPLRALSSRR